MRELFFFFSQKANSFSRVLFVDFILNELRHARNMNVITAKNMDLFIFHKTCLVRNYNADFASNPFEIHRFNEVFFFLIYSGLIEQLFVI